MSVLAVRAGKDVICEKPTYSIEEGQILVREVRKHSRVFQTSTEDRSVKCYHQMAEAVRNGRIGDVKSVQVYLPPGKRYPHEKPVAVPPGFDYDLWLGPAPAAPFTAHRTERMHWRSVWDYSGGLLTDWGMHQLDTVQWALGTEHTGPVEVDGQGTINEGSMYNTFVDYDLRYRYASGIELSIKSGGTALRFDGSDGWIGNAHFRAPCEASSAEILAFSPSVDDVNLHTNPGGEHRDFLDALKTRRDPYFPVEAGHRCASLLHIGNIAMRLGRKLRWNPKAERFVGDAEADAMCSRPHAGAMVARLIHRDVVSAWV